MTHRGRPKTFDRETALDAAMLLFWERGFEQTCVDDLAAAMGIQTSSLYATFGDKEKLFLEAIEHYRTGRGSVYEELTRKDQPSGCMLCLALPTCSPKYDHLQQELDRLRTLSDAVLLRKLQEGLRNKEIPISTDLRMLVSYFRTALWGMSLQARAGADRETLLEIGRLALRVWPSSAPTATAKVL